MYIFDQQSIMSDELEKNPEGTTKKQFYLHVYIYIS
jgi:hypothetical protein